MGPIELVIVKTDKVSCDGTKGGSTHPLVYLYLGKDGSVTCPYCSKCFSSKALPKNINFLKSKTQ